jgi:methyl-accepting chemotaxis protein
MKLAAKITIAVLLALVVAIGVGVIGSVNIKKIDKLDTELYQVNAAPLGEIGVAAISFHRTRVNLRDVILAPNAADAKKKADRIAELEKTMTENLDKFEKSIAAPEVRQKFDTLKADILKYNDVRDETIELAKAGKKAEALALMNGEGSKLNTAVNDGLDWLIDKKVTQAKEKSDANTVTANAALTWMISLIIGGLVLSGIFAGVVIADITRTLRNLNDETRNLTDAALAGKLETRADASKVSEEFQPIVVGFNSVLDAVIGPMNEAAAVLAELADNNLTARVQGDYAGDLGVIKANLNRAMDALEATVVEITGIAAQVADAAAQVASAADNVGKASQEVAGGSSQVAGGAAEQTRSATEAATNMEQLQRAIEEVARGAQAQAMGAEQATKAAQDALAGVREIVNNAEAARADAQTAGAVAQNGASIVDETVAGMGRVRAASTDSATRITALSESSQRIGEIVEAINDIAEQTNLLALNAAIEAARAGEHGKGFAVVADEVRKLAERSAAQTKEIAALIRGIQDGISAAVNSMAVAGQEVDSGVALANKAGTALAEILAAADKVVAQAAGVAERARGVEGNAAQVLSAAENVSSASEESTAATEEMAASSSEVTRAIEHVAAVTEQSSATSEELSAAAEEATALVEEMSAASKELADLADRTRVLLATFTVTGDQPAAKSGGNGKSNGKSNGKLQTSGNGAFAAQLAGRM